VMAVLMAVAYHTTTQRVILRRPLYRELKALSLPPVSTAFGTLYLCASYHGRGQKWCRATRYILTSFVTPYKLGYEKALLIA
jgi:CRISPR/Cas system-associated protein Cas5 (RAMP superfamily)